MGGMEREQMKKFLLVLCLLGFAVVAGADSVNLDMDRDGKIDPDYIPDMSHIYQTVMGSDDNYVTDAEKTVIGNTSGTNTGDQTLVDTATTALSGDSATNFFSSGTIEDERLPDGLMRDAEAVLAYEPLRGVNDNYVTDTDITKLSLLPSSVVADAFMVTNSDGAIKSDTSIPVDLSGFSPNMVIVSSYEGLIGSHQDVDIYELFTAADGADFSKGTFENRITSIEGRIGVGGLRVLPGTENLNEVAAIITVGHNVNSIVKVWLSDTNGGPPGAEFDGAGGTATAISDADVLFSYSGTTIRDLLTGPDGDAVVTMRHSDAESPATKYLCASNSGTVVCGKIDFTASTTTYERTIDNVDPGFSTVGTWYSSTGDPGFLGTNYVYSRNTYGTSATWTFDDIPADGNYEVFVQYPIGYNYDTSVYYTMTDSFQSQISAAVNMLENGGSMQSIGTYALKAGTVSVKLTWDAVYVAADAVKIVKVP